MDTAINPNPRSFIWPITPHISEASLRSNVRLVAVPDISTEDGASEDRNGSVSVPLNVTRHRIGGDGEARRGEDAIARRPITLGESRLRHERTQASDVLDRGIVRLIQSEHRGRSVPAREGGSRLLNSQTQAPIPVNPPALPFLVEARFRVPIAGPGFLDRAAVHRALDQAAGHGLILVAAPTGFGKTTAVATWLRQRPEPIAWLSLESTEDRPDRLATYLVAAIRRALPNVGTDALAALQNPYVEIATEVVGSLTNDLNGQASPVVLVLDDYHVIRHRACHEVVSALLAARPPQLLVVIISRSDPPLSLGRMRAYGGLGEVRAPDLRFNVEEVRRYVNEVRDYSLDPAEVGALEERTEGWPAALSLAELSMAASDDPSSFVRTFTGSSRHVVDYLASEVLDAQPAHLRSWLLETCLLERVCGALADSVTGIPGGRAILAGLERSNLFVSRLDGDGDWFRFHRMFREAMRAMAAQEEPGASERVLAAAARWHEARGELDDAVRYAVAAGDRDLAARMVARHYVAFMRGGQVSELRELVALLDLDHLGAPRGAIAFVAAMAAALDGEPAAVVDEFVAVVESAGFADCHPEPVSIPEAAVVHMRAAFLYDDAGRGYAAAAQLLERWHDSPTHLGAARLGLGYVAYLRGELATARRILEPVGERIDPDILLASIFCLSTRALVELESGNRELGARLARVAYHETLERGLRDAVSTAIAHEAMGGALLAEGSVTEAAEILQRAVELTRPTQSLHRAAALLTLAEARAREGDTNAALACVAESRQLVEASRDPAGLPRRIRRVEATIRKRGSASSDDHAPTAAELRVLRLLPSELTMREIGQELYVSHDTVKTHARQLYRKLGASSRAEAIQRAREVGLL